MVMRGVQRTQSRTVTSMMVGVIAHDLGSTFVPLTTAHSLTVHDGRRLPRRPADKGRVFDHRALKVAPVNRHYHANREIKNSSHKLSKIIFVLVFLKNSDLEQ